jgi:uncharacterized protein
MSMETEQYARLNGVTRDRLDTCRAILRTFRSVVVAFSAGVDSTFLLALSVRTLGPESVLAAIGISPSLASREREAGRRIAGEIGAELVEVETSELRDAAYAANPARRCYYCKRSLFTALGALAGERGFEAVLCGANADDTGDFRPGIEAGEELGVRSPLLEAGLTKKDIRAASRAMGLPTWDKPAMACLASRVPYGQTITPEKLSRVERAEYAIRDLGFPQCRVRDHDPLARIEVLPEAFGRIVESRQAIVESLMALGYRYVTLDLKGFRSGSMNEVLSIKTEDDGS